MPEIGLSLSGIDQIRSELDKLTAKQSQKLMRDAARAGADVIARSVRVKAPVAKRPPNKGSNALSQGFLQADIGVTTSAASDGSGAIATVAPGKQSRHVAGWVASGHLKVKGGYLRVDKRRGTVRGKGRILGGGKTLSNPFVERAATDAQQRAVEAAEAKLLEGYKEVGALD